MRLTNGRHRYQAMHKKRRNPEGLRLSKLLLCFSFWLRGQDLNLRPSRYEPDSSPRVSAVFWLCRC